jgi:hypothetical protein
MNSELGIVVEASSAGSGFSTNAVLRRQPLKIGMLVTYHARQHVVVGITPMSVTPQLLELEDADSGRTRHVKSTDRDLELASREDTLIHAKEQTRHDPPARHSTPLAFT